MSGSESVTLAELVSSLLAAGKTMPAEVGAFLTLEAVERALDVPSTLALDSVRIMSDGVVEVLPATIVPDEADTTARAAGLLGHALLGTGSAPPAPLLALVERGPSDGSARLASFRDELEACLLPLNRGASRRILSRFVREGRGGPGAAAYDVSVVDARLDAWLAGESLAPTPAATATQSLDEELPPSEALGLEERPEDARPRSGVPWKTVGLVVVILGGLGGALGAYRAGLFTGPSDPSAPTPAAGTGTTAAAGKYGDLTVHTADRAQIFLRVGRGPAVATNLPVGIAHEFIAFGAGHGPGRAVVPPDARWSPTERGPHFQLTIPLEGEATPFEALELGETQLPREVGSHRGEVGTVRIETVPEGAEVFLLIGFGPDVSVRDLRADQPYELLVYAPGHVPVRAPLASRDFTEGPDGALSAQLDVNLRPR